MPVITNITVISNFAVAGQLGLLHKLWDTLFSTLHSGEASCLSIAYHRQWTLLSDDKAARQASANMQVPVSGTVGVLLALVKRRLLPVDEADGVLEHMIQSGYYSPVASLKEILQD
jgi:predicted nucleic acid-binding protein